MFRHLNTFLKQNIWKYILGVIIVIFVDLLQLVTPQIIQRFTDALVAGTADMDALIRYAVLIMLVSAGIVISRFLWRILLVASARRLEAFLREKFFDHLETLPRGFFNRYKTGDLMAHATNDINAIRQAFGFGVIMITDSVFLTIMTIATMATTISARLTVIALVPMPLIALFVFLLGRVIQAKFKAVQEAFSVISEKVQESFSGIRVIKAFSQEKLDLDDFNEKNLLNLRANMSLAKTFAIMFPLITFIASISMVIGVTYGAKMVIDGEISVGEYVAFMSYVEILTWPMMAIGWVINIVQRGRASLDRINDILDQSSDLIDCSECKAPANNSIELRNLSFTYPGTDIKVLDDVTFTVPHGTTLGILGRTGSGKTTIVNLLCRLYNFDKDSIFIGGVDLRDISVKDTREMIGIVPQDNFLFSSTIGENIALVDTEPSMRKIMSSSATSQIKSEIESFPDGFDTLLGEKGINLSGGQKQRTSMARALYKDPDIMILDDSLSAVDTKTEETILGYLMGELGKRTSIVISHRISTLRNLDNIVVIDEGKVLESGTHADLVRNKGLYFDIYEKQLLEEKLRREQ